jgi:hypothetical protein
MSLDENVTDVPGRSEAPRVSSPQTAVGAGEGTGDGDLSGWRSRIGTPRARGLSDEVTPRPSCSHVERTGLGTGESAWMLTRGAHFETRESSVRAARRWGGAEELRAGLEDRLVPRLPLTAFIREVRERALTGSSSVAPRRACREPDGRARFEGVASASTAASVRWPAVSNLFDCGPFWGGGTAPCLVLGRANIRSTVSALERPGCFGRGTRGPRSTCTGA